MHSGWIGLRATRHNINMLASSLDEEAGSPQQAFFTRTRPRTIRIEAFISLSTCRGIVNLGYETFVLKIPQLQDNHKSIAVLS